MSTDVYKDVHSHAVYNIGNLGAETQIHTSGDMFKDVQSRALYKIGNLGAKLTDTFLQTCTRMSRAGLFTMLEFWEQKLRHTCAHMNKFVPRRAVYSTGN